MAKVTRLGKRLRAVLFAVGAVACLVTCAAQTDSRPSEAKAPPARPIDEVPEDILLSGQYCYRHEDETLSENVRITVTVSRVTGEAQGTVHDEPGGYFTSYIQRVSGTLTGNSAVVSLTTWIEYDVQQSEERWQIRDTELVTATNRLKAADCAQVSQAFQDADGFEASDLIAGATAVHEKRVKFAPGDMSFTTQGGVIRGERDVYIVEARGGQVLSLEIGAVDDNAAFDVITPSGLILAREATAKEFRLPETGDYQIIVGATWGNTTYKLSVAIR